MILFPGESRTTVTEPEDYRQAGTGHAIKFFWASFSFKKKTLLFGYFFFEEKETGLTRRKKLLRPVAECSTAME